MLLEEIKIHHRVCKQSASWITSIVKVSMEVSQKFDSILPLYRADAADA